VEYNLRPTNVSALLICWYAEADSSLAGPKSLQLAAPMTKTMKTKKTTKTRKKKKTPWWWP
jgi:hypothetical protein